MAGTGDGRAEPLGGVSRLGGGTRGSGTAPRTALVVPQKSPGYFARSWRRFRRNTLSMVALGIFLLMVLFSYGAPLISRFVSHQTFDAQSLSGQFATIGETKSGFDFTKPGGQVTNRYWLGSDELGRDALTRLAYGGRVSLTVAFLTMVLALTVGLLVGATAGFYGGWLEGLLMRLVDIFLSIPGLFLLILVSSLINNNRLIAQSPFFRDAGWLVLPFVIASLSWTGISRLIRGEVLAIKGRDYIEAARVLGASDGRIIFRHILPNVVPVVIIWATLVIPGLILTEASLSYLGFGVQIPTPSWGNMLTKATEYFTRAPSLVLLPGLAIYITVVAVNLMGNGLRDALDPRLND